MKEFEVKKIKDCKNIIGQKPSNGDYTLLIDEPTKFVKDGKIVMIYDKLEDSYLVQAKEIAKSTNVNKSRRQASGIPTMSSVFGAVSKNGVRNYRCSGAVRNKLEKQNFKKITTLARLIAQKYKECMPSNYEADVKNVLNSVESDYIFDGLPFSTFNANVNQIIKYHIDRGNVNGVMSNVLISRQGVSGGELVFPEYGFALSQKDGYYSVFDGQSEIHGVAECKFVSSDAYRCSFVFYTLEQMKHCKPYLEEIEQEKIVYTQKNKNRSKTFGMSKSDFSRGKYNDQN